MGGQRLKLHHKSHPERKHGMIPPPPSSTPLPSLPCGPALSSLLSCVSLPSPFVSMNRECPVDGPGVFYITPSSTSNARAAQFLLTPPLSHLLLSLGLPLLPFSSLRPPACCEAINHSRRPDRQRQREKLEEGGGNTGDRKAEDAVEVNRR